MPQNTKGFTLVEVMVSLIIAITIIGGMFFMFRSLTDDLVGIRYLNRTYEALETFRSDYTDLKRQYPVVLASTGGIFTNSPYGFQAVVLTDSGQTAGFLIAAEDLIASKLIVGSGSYSHIVPFLMSMTGGQITEAKTNLVGFLNGVDLSKGNDYRDINIIRLNFTSMNNMSLGKLDFSITSAYFDSFQGRSLQQILSEELFSVYAYSILR